MSQKNDLSFQLDSTTERPIAQQSTNAAAHVHLTGTGPTGATHNRNINAAATTHPGNDTTNTATWTTGENVTELNIGAIATVAGAYQNDEAFLAVINAPTATIAKNWLDDAGGAALDVQYHFGFLGQTLNIQSTDPITRLDVLPLNVAMRVFVGAA